jgi:hypothetical protein
MVAAATAAVYFAGANPARRPIRLVTEETMNDTFPYVWRAVLAASLAAVVAVGCESSEKRTEATATGPASASEEATSKEESTSQHREHYELESPVTAVRVDHKERTEFSVTPTGDLKINHEFPWSFEFSPPAGVKLAQTSFSKEQIELSDERATMAMIVEVDEGGEHRLEATGNFSVCTDTKCYVIRDEPVEFVLKADDASPDDPK